MIEFVAHNLAPISFIVVMGMLLLGYPVAFTLAAGGLFFFVVGVELSHISSEIRLFWPLLQAHLERMLGAIEGSLPAAAAALAILLWGLLRLLPAHVTPRRRTLVAAFVGVVTIPLGELAVALVPLVVALSLLVEGGLTALLESASVLTAAITMLVVGMRVFGLTFIGIEGPEWILSFLPFSAASIIVGGAFALAALKAVHVSVVPRSYPVGTTA